MITQFILARGRSPPVTAPLMPENIPGMKEIKGLIKVDIINLNKKSAMIEYYTLQMCQKQGKAATRIDKSNYIFLCSTAKL